MVSIIKEVFRNKFSYDGEIIYCFCPLSSVLLGEFNKISLSCTLGLGCHGGVRIRSDNKVFIYDLNREVLLEDDISIRRSSRDYNILNHVKSVLFAFMKKGYNIKCGFDMVLYKDDAYEYDLIPSMGSLITHLLCICNSFNIGNIEESYIAHFSEKLIKDVDNELYVYLYVLLSSKDSVLILNKSSLEYRHAPFKLIDHSIMFFKSVDTSIYKKRFRSILNSIREYEEHIKRYRNINSIEDLTPYEFKTFEHIVENEFDREVLRYIVCEKKRIKSVYEDLLSMNMNTFLDILSESRYYFKCLFNHVMSGNRAPIFNVEFFKDKECIEGVKTYMDCIRVKVN